MSKQPHFDINAAVVKQLGEELVSDEVTALIELVKNAYDADASYANVIVDTNNWPAESLFYTEKENDPAQPGYILIEDDGIGMTISEIDKGWLTISFSAKRDMRIRGELTPKKKRTPLGKKGVGRLSTQRLGSRLELFTQKDPELVSDSERNIQYHVAFDWNDFSEDKTLTDVPVDIKSIITNKPIRGTRLFITNLREPGVWLGEAQQKLLGQLSQLIFPFEEVRPFNVYLTINGIRFDLQTISSTLRDVSLSRFEFNFNKDGDKKLWLKGRIKLPRLKGLGEDREEIYNQILGKDQGKNFFSYLVDKSNRFSISGLEYLGKDGWFVLFEQTLDYSSISGWVLDKNGNFASPGEFHGEIDEFLFRGVNLDPLEDIYSKGADYRDFVAQHVGIRIYRDGFGIRPYGFEGNDWLGLGGGQTSGRSFYGLRPRNVIGFISLTAQENSQLEEKTDREGFIDNPYSRNFLLIMGKFVGILDVFFNNLRRSYNEFKKQYSILQTGQVFSENVFEEIHQTSSAAQLIENQVIKFDQGLDTITDSVQEIVNRVQKTPLLASQEERKLSPILSEAGEKLSEAKSMIHELRALLGRLRNLETRAISLEAEMAILEDQLTQFSELAGLGLTAEALSHEIHTVADNLAEKTKLLTEIIKTKQLSNSDVVTYTEYVHSAISALRKQLSHLAPSLRYVRDMKDDINLLDFLEDLRNFYLNGRFRGSSIKIRLEEPFDNFAIQINKGKLTQIVDNLVLNSEYWLKEAVKRKEIDNPIISFRSGYPFLSIFDNGLGIDRSIENSLFQPFVTTKPKNIGRGLGLFIVRELLDSSGCSVMLLPERNRFDRRYIFQIDLTGVMHGGQK
jgi:signal transduction histidine kinase